MKYGNKDIPFDLETQLITKTLTSVAPLKSIYSLITAQPAPNQMDALQMQTLILTNFKKPKQARTYFLAKFFSKVCLQSVENLK